MINFKMRLLCVLFTITGFFMYGQEMQKGFEHLEAGEFSQAEIFFSKILKEHPENKTARLCYGRAVGLSSDPDKAVKIFEDLLIDFPDDLEVKLNYAESLLWSRQYPEAEVYYSVLLEENPENFAVLLGYANTLSNLKKYKSATKWVEKALNLSPGNPNALNSLKYIRLGYANQLLQERQYDLAIGLLDDNLREFENDRESLLNKANIYLILKNSDAAIDVYKQLALDSRDSIQALTGISLAYHIAKREKDALKYATMARQMAKDSNDSISRLMAAERYIQALIWNHKYSRAEDQIEHQLELYPAKPWVLALAASLGMYTGDFKKSINNYNQILEIDSASFDGNLGIANAYFARGEIKEAMDYAEQTLSFYKNQQDAEQLLQKIEFGYRPMLEENLSFSFDNGDNQAFAAATTVRLPLSTKLEVLGGYTYRKTRNTRSGLEANSDYLNLSASYKIIPSVKFRINTGLINARSVETDYTNLTGEIAAQIQPFMRDDLEIGYRRDLQDFNAELLNRKIAGNHLFLTNNYTTRYGLGWYLQYMHTEQSDDNSRELLFTSLYYSILKKPLLKGGINYQYISFEKRMPELYFSPEKFQAAEIFMNLISNDEDKAFNYDLTAAAGYQFIEDGDGQPTYRLQARAGYNISQRFIGGVYATHSNIASATAAGFTFTEFGINLKWFFKAKPLFNLK